MPVHNNSTGSDRYFHIYNFGVDDRNIFSEKEDYEVFLNYLKEYLNPPPDPKHTKKTFSIKGKEYKGVPHQPKNYFKSIELIAFSIQPNHFHLVLDEKQKNFIEKLIRSLCTRYAIYYNKKHHRRGSLFAGPYKSVQVENLRGLLLLTHHLHRESINSKGSSHSYNSYKYYLGEKKSEFLKPRAVLSFFNDPQNYYLRRFINYKNYVENYELHPKDREILDNIVIEKKSAMKKEPSRSVPATTDLKVTQKTPLKPTPESQLHPKPPSKEKTGLPEFITASVGVFMILFILGLRNVNTTKAIQEDLSNTQDSPPSQVAGIETTEQIDVANTPILTPAPTSTPTPPQTKEDINKVGSQPTTKPQNVNNTESEQNSFLTVSSENDLVCNIRKEPSLTSEVITTAKDGDTFEFTSYEAGWYQIKLNNILAYISEVCAHEKGE